MPSDVVDNSEFPIRMNEWHVRNGPKKGQAIPTDEWREIRTLAGKERRAIEWLQPYKGWERRWPRPRSRIGQLRAGLADIHRFDIIDKHHQPHLTAAVLIAVGQPDFPGEDFGFRQKPVFMPADGPLVPLESSALVDRWTFTRRPPPKILDMHHGVISGIGMEPDPGHRIDVLPNLGGSVWVVADVMERFAKLFPPPAEPLVSAQAVSFSEG